MAALRLDRSTFNQAEAQIRALGSRKTTAHVAPAHAAARQLRGFLNYEGNFAPNVDEKYIALLQRAVRAGIESKDVPLPDKAADHVLTVIGHLENIGQCETNNRTQAANFCRYIGTTDPGTLGRKKF